SAITASWAGNDLEAEHERNGRLTPGRHCEQTGLTRDGHTDASRWRAGVSFAGVGDEAGEHLVRARPHACRGKRHAYCQEKIAGRGHRARRGPLLTPISTTSVGRLQLLDWCAARRER